MKKPLDDPPIRKSVTLPESLWKDIDAYGSEEKIATQAEAVRRLLMAALRGYRRTAKK